MILDCQKQILKADLNGCSGNKRSCARDTLRWVEEEVGWGVVYVDPLYAHVFSLVRLHSLQGFLLFRPTGLADRHMRRDA